MQKIRWFFLILAIVITLAAMLQNQQVTEVSLFWLKQTMPLSMLLLASVTIGFLFGSLTTASMLRSHRKKKEAAAKQVPKQIEREKPAESTRQSATTE